MTRINLLPVKASKKQETIKQQIIIFSAVVVIVAAVLAAVNITLSGKVKSAEAEISNSNNEIAALKKKIGEIDNIKKLQAEVKKKLDVLDQLRKEKSGPSKRMAALSDAVPEKLWLTKYSESGEKVSISGLSFSEELVAQFLRNLQGSADYANVELLVSEQTEVNGTKLKKFDITCSIKKNLPPEPPKQETKK